MAIGLTIPSAHAHTHIGSRHRINTSDQGRRQRVNVIGAMRCGTSTRPYVQQMCNLSFIHLSISHTSQSPHRRSHLVYISHSPTPPLSNATHTRDLRTAVVLHIVPPYPPPLPVQSRPSHSSHFLPVRK